MTKLSLSTQQKEAIGQKLMDAYKSSGFESRAKYAVSLGITGSDLSNIENAKWKKNDRLLSAQKWIRIAQRVGFEFSPKQRWVTAPTMTYRMITKQLEMCRKEGLCAIFCDEAGIGKTHAVREFASQTTNAFYINGGAHPRKLSFIRALAQSVGINSDKQSTEQTLNDTITYLKALANPVIIIDEAGDLDNTTYLLLKHIYNELEFVCGMYMIGARGLKKRIDSAIRNRTNGFEEVFSRFGSRYSAVLPIDIKARREFIRIEAETVAETNGLKNVEKLNKLLNAECDLRRIRREVIKSRIAA